MTTQSQHSLDLDSVLFVHTPKSEPDRGWEPQDVEEELRLAGISVRHLHCRNPVDLEIQLAAYPSSIAWPLDYTFTSAVTGIKVVEVLDYLHFPYIGCRPAGARFTSKLDFKKALRDADLRTPSWHEIDAPYRYSPWGDYPAFVKTEYSCDSYGVRLALDPTQVAAHATDLTSQFDQQVFIEAHGGTRESTVASIVINGSLYGAAMRMRPRSAPYIDSYAKSHNEAITFEKESEGAGQPLLIFCQAITRQLKLSGYFRLDVVSNARDELTAIDLNILPSLHSDRSQLSYLPMAFMQYGYSYSDVIAAILASAEFESRKCGAPLVDYALSSRLLVSDGHNLLGRTGP